MMSEMGGKISREKFVKIGMGTRWDEIEEKKGKLKCGQLAEMGMATAEG
jgi:hypothetical protein